MFFHNLKVALRISRRNPVYTLINFFGVSIGLAVCILISLYIQNELSYDKYHRNSDRIYRLANKSQGSGPSNTMAKVWGPFGPAAKAEIPGVEDLCRFSPSGEMLFFANKKKLYEKTGFYADSTVFDVFSWPLLQGNKRTALTEPNSIVLTKTLAEKYYGALDPVGESIIIDNGTPYRITGVMEDIPFNSHFHSDFLVSMRSYPSAEIGQWTRPQFYTYLLLDPGTTASAIDVKLDQLLSRNVDSATSASTTPFLQPLTSIHLHSKLFREIETNSDISYIYIAGSLGLFIILIACLNFVNLSTVQTIRRSGETGIRKVNGASRGLLIWQYLSESFLVCIAAALFALGISFVTLPYLNTFLQTHLTLQLFSNPWLYIGLPVFVIIVSLLSGLYPAFILSSFKPISMLSRRFSSKGHTGLRKALVVSQFAISGFLIIAAIVSGRQLQYIRNKNLGFNKDQVINIPFHDDQTGLHINEIKEQLRHIPGVQQVSASANRPGGTDYGIPYNIPGLLQTYQPEMRCLVVDEDFINTYQMQVVKGRNFQADMATDSAAYLLNEEAVRILDLKDPVGRLMEMPVIHRAPGPIIGIVKDFHYHSLHDKIAPLYFMIQKPWFNQFSIRIDAGQADKTIALLKEKWSAIEPAYPFAYSFFDETFGKMYNAESRLAILIRIFTFLAVFIACLGLFGLAAYTINQRAKEIGIRKIIGAGTARIIALLSKDFLLLVLIASVIAFPIAWWAMNIWLREFAYRINISGWVFVIAGAMALAIAMIAISFQAIKAAIANPVKSLRAE
ncbi:MAG TPA: ABC transporter permease [Chitinophagaceae bacterium]|nr:ABC transporter permease [Chitinophagaceae bacterium]